MKAKVGANGTRSLAGKLVDIYGFPDGRLEIRWKEVPTAYSGFDQLQRVGHAAIIENMRRRWPTMFARIG